MAPADSALILIVDDEDTNRRVLEAMLTSEGFRLISAATGEAALAMIEQEPPDLILLDVMLPDVDGFTILQRLRDRGSRAPVIFLTAKGLLMDMAEGEDAGSDLYLIKPVLATKLINMVGMFLSSDAPLAKKRRNHTAAS